MKLISEQTSVLDEELPHALETKHFDEIIGLRLRVVIQIIPTSVTRN